jgi:outer membrane autotransporter protein
VGPTDYVCNSGELNGDLIDTDGRNTLTFGTGGNGIIRGNVVFGVSDDVIDMLSGTITGNVQQGAGIDRFRMEAGTIQSLNQGDNRDIFFMSGGRIIDAFDDGDVAVLTGGRIGRINLKLDDNYFGMSGGTVDRNVVAGFGNDRFEWDGGGIVYGEIDLGPDDDIARLANLTDAHVGMVPRLAGGTGNDALTLENATTGSVGRFEGWEVINLINDTELVFDQTLVLGDAGTGTGSLNLSAGSTIFAGDANSAVRAAVAGQFVNVTNAGRVELTNGSGGVGDTFTIAGNYLGNNGLLLLDTVLAGDNAPSDRLIIDGGTASGTTGIGVVNAGGGGALTTGNGILVVDAINGGLTSAGAFALASRVAAGAYEYFLFRGGPVVASSQNWYLRSTISADQPYEIAAAPDPLSPGATIVPDQPQTAAPPPPQQQAPPPVLVPDLPGDQDDLAPPVNAGDSAPVAPPEAPEASPPTPAQAYLTPSGLPPLPGFSGFAPTPGATPVIGGVVPLHRIEVPTYAAAQPAAHNLARAMLGTFHERRGEQYVLLGDQPDTLTWGRLIGSSDKTTFGGTVSPSIDGYTLGFQAGQDVAIWQADNDAINRLGVFVGRSGLDATIRGQALGWNNLTVGTIDLGATSLGGYWTYIAPEQYYLDAVLMGSWLDGNATSSAGAGIGLSGSAITASLEAGYPLALSDTWTIEPQGQLIWSGLTLSDRQDAFSAVDFDDSSTFTARLGLRLEGEYEMEAGILRPFVQADLWHNVGSTQRTTFGTTPIDTTFGGTSLELGAGLTADLGDSVTLHGRTAYMMPLGAEGNQGFKATLGLSVKW